MFFISCKYLHVTVHINEFIVQLVPLIFKLVILHTRSDAWEGTQTRQSTHTLLVCQCYSSIAYMFTVHVHVHVQCNTSVANLLKLTSAWDGLPLTGLGIWAPCNQQHQAHTCMNNSCYKYNLMWIDYCNICVQTSDVMYFVTKILNSCHQYYSGTSIIGTSVIRTLDYLDASQCYLYV